MTINHIQLDEKGSLVNCEALNYQSLGRASRPTVQLSRMRNELSRVRVYATVMTGVAVLLAVGSVMLAFEVLRLRDVIGGVL